MKEFEVGGLTGKLDKTKQLIMDWYHQFNGQVYISFSGGKDSTVLLDIVRKLYPDVPAVFVNTSLEFPEIVDFVKTIDNVTIIRPKMNFRQVVAKYGWPIVSKEQASYIYQYRRAKSEKQKKLRWEGNKDGRYKISKKWRYLVTDHPELKISSKCCDVMKKRPFHIYEKETGRKPFVGIMAGESKLRLQFLLRDECNAFNAKRPVSRPILGWSEDDIWEYIKQNGIKYSKIYDMGYERTGCMFCAFGHHLDLKKGRDRFKTLSATHPKHFKYCMDKLGMRQVMEIYLKNEKISRNTL